MAEQVRYLVRIANTDVDGTKQIWKSLCKIKGVNIMFSNMACHLAGIEKTRKAGTLLDAEVKKLEEVILDPAKHHAPHWMLNRRRDPETGDNTHFITSKLDFAKDNDIKMMKKIKSYKGIRHMFGLPARGQRTKSKHRKNKSRGKASLGVKRRPDAKSGRT